MQQVEIGVVGQCWRYPVKSMQGSRVPSLTVGTHGVAGDRVHSLLDSGTGHVLSAKRVSQLLWASGDADRIHLPDGTEVPLDAPERDELLSAWLGRDVTVLSLEPGEQGAGEHEGLSYEMTFDPPDDDAEYVPIPLPEHGFVDLSPLHLLSAATLRSCESARSDLDWDVRRFRPNVVVEGDGDGFVEDGWVGATLQLGASCVLRVLQPTVRCAMPLRAQPAGPGGEPPLERRAELFNAMGELHEAHPHHLGVYAEVVTPGVVAEGDPVLLGSA